MMAAAFARSPEFAARPSGMIGKIIRRISEWEGAGEADLLSYILFDGEFSARLIELGRNDAKARHAELCRVFRRTRAAHAARHAKRLTPGQSRFAPTKHRLFGQLEWPYGGSDDRSGSEKSAAAVLVGASLHVRPKKDGDLVGRCEAVGKNS